MDKALRAVFCRFCLPKTETANIRFCLQDRELAPLADESEPTEGFVDFPFLYSSIS